MLTRRQILLTAASGALLPYTGLAAREKRRQAARWIVVDRRNSLACESARGFQAALRRTGERFEVSDAVPLCRAELIVLPFAGTLPQRQVSQLRSQLASGCSVIFESGASFASHDEKLRQRMMWRQAFGIHADLPPSAPACPVGDPPDYVRYHWPADVQIRHFGEFFPVDISGAEEIAIYREGTVAIRKRIGVGELLFLGSPLGPMLAAEDHQAAELTAGMIQHSMSI
jgi:hypothetical protein